MKKAYTYLLLALLPSLLYAQEGDPAFTRIIKTNVLLAPNWQQWRLAFEVGNMDKPKRAAGVIFGYNQFSDSTTYKEKQSFLGYRYMFIDRNHIKNGDLFFAPHIKLMWRDKYDKNDCGGGIIIFCPHSRDFKSFSLVTGGSLGFHYKPCKWLVVGFEIGLGLGVVLDYTEGDLYNSEPPTVLHPDFDGLLLLGFRF